MLPCRAAVLSPRPAFSSHYYTCGDSRSRSVGSCTVARQTIFCTTARCSSLHQRGTPAEAVYVDGHGIQLIARWQTEDGRMGGSAQLLALVDGPSLAASRRLSLAGPKEPFFSPKPRYPILYRISSQCPRPPPPPPPPNAAAAAALTSDTPYPSVYPPQAVWSQRYLSTAALLC
jgi:hypothetical protein